MQISCLGRAFASVACVALAVSPALAEKASQLTSINGMSGSRAESALMDRGFTFIGSNNASSGYTYAHWWHAGSKNCITTETRNDMVLTVTDASASDCHQKSGNSDAAVAAGVVAGAAILGALLTHKSHHHDDRQHLSEGQAEMQYERGYTDGLHNAAYHNYETSERYAQGYTAGVDERNANLSHHSGRGGHAAYAQINDLSGARAAGGMEDLERRGFRQVDNFTSGDTRYSIQYRPQSRQCVQVTIADGKFYDVRDIEQHPKCR